MISKEVDVGHDRLPYPVCAAYFIENSTLTSWASLAVVTVSGVLTTVVVNLAPEEVSICNPGYPTSVQVFVPVFVNVYVLITLPAAPCTEVMCATRSAERQRPPCLEVEVEVPLFEDCFEEFLVDDELVDLVVVDDGLLDDPHAAKVMPAPTISAVATSDRFGLMRALENKYFGIFLLLSPVNHVVSGLP